MPSTITVTAPAKINLALHVVGQRDNGYHELESLVVFADFGDELSASVSNTDVLEITGPFAGSLNGGRANLVAKAVAAFRDRWPEAVNHGVKIVLEKNLPVAAGIGGGSADAAAALRIMETFSRQNIPANELAELALQLGADVPLCLSSRTCIARGVGEIVQPLQQFPACYLVLINPLQAISTADIFRRLTNKQNAPLPPLPFNLTHIPILGLWMAETRNDLEAPATELMPRIALLTEALRNTHDCVAARMSGSGATVFGLYGSEAAAHQGAHDMRQKFPDCWIAPAPVIRR